MVQAPQKYSELLLHNKGICCLPTLPNFKVTKTIIIIKFAVQQGLFIFSVLLVEY